MAVYLEVQDLSESTLAAGISDTSTSFTVATGEGSAFPTGQQIVLITDEVVYELIFISSRSGDTFTVGSSGRGQSVTSAATWSSGAFVRSVIAKRHYEDLVNQKADYLVGEIKQGLFLSVPQGWLSLNGETIGNASSSADNASDDYEELFDIVKTLPPNLGTESWAANDSVTLPDARGRALIGSGQGLGLTNRALATLVGSETHQLTEAELATHSHSIRAGDDSGSGAFTAIGNYPGYDFTETSTSYNTAYNGTMASDVVSETGSGNAHNNMQPSLVVLTIIKF